MLARPRRAGQTELTKLLVSAARNIAGWHECSLAALGIAGRWDKNLWWSDAPGPVIYHRAITLSRQGAGGQVAALRALLARWPRGPFSMCDSFSALDLGGMGLVPEPGRWLVRQPGPTGRVEAPAGLTIEEVVDAKGMRDFEIASIDGFESPGLHELGPLGLHAAPVLADERMNVFVGRVNGQLAGAAMAFASDRLVGVYGVATLPEHRRRGIGAALTLKAALVEPDLPSVLQPSDIGEGMYRRLGYKEAGAFTNWHRL